MTKAKIIDKGLETIILQERHFLGKFNSQFVINVLCTFQNKNNLFLVMELITGGDLQFHILNYDYYFTETQLKFLVTNIIIGLEHIHKKDIIHCNIKPDNIMFDSKGFVKIIGFGDSCLNGSVMDDNIINSDASEFMAPECFQKDELDFTADFYSLGIVLYQLMSGKIYNPGDEDIDISTDEKVKDKYSDFCIDFVNGLLKINPSERLGSKEYEKEIKEHNFLIGMKWDLIKKRSYISPISDIIKFSRIKTEYPEIFDYDLCNKKKDKVTPEQIQNYIEIVEGKAYPMYFQYYTCMRVENILRELNRKDEDYKNNYYYLGKDKKIKKSQSSETLSFNFSEDYKRHKHHKHHQHHKSKKYENIYELPYIGNKTEIQKKREKKIRQYYENKILKYKDYLRKMRKKNNDVQYIQAKYMDSNHPMYKHFYPKHQSQRLLMPMKQMKQMKQYDNNYNNNSFLPNIIPPQNNYFEMPKRNNMDKAMSKFFNKMSEDRNNFFIKFNKKNYLDKKANNSQYESSFDSSFSESEERIRNKYFNNPYYVPNNPYYKKMYPGLIQEVYSVDKTIDSDESETTSIRYMNNGNNNQNMNMGQYNKNQNIVNNNDEEESEESEESEDSEESEEEES